MGTQRHLDKGRRRRYSYDRDPFPARRVTPEEAALKRSQLFTAAEDRNHFMDVFSRVRRRYLKCYDTDGLLLAYEVHHDHVAIAAYHEALASTRQPGWAE